MGASLYPLLWGRWKPADAIKEVAIQHDRTEGAVRHAIEEGLAQNWLDQIDWRTEHPIIID